MGYVGWARSRMLTLLLVATDAELQKFGAILHGTARGAT
jgi:hypothetical protein